MKTKSIYYKSGYKYQLVERYSEMLNFKPNTEATTQMLHFNVTGLLSVKKYYAWDGPSGPAFHTNNFMRGSLVHDALYQLIRLRLLPEYRRIDADNELRRICREDGMSTIRAWWIYRAVRAFGGPSAIAGDIQQVIKAP